MSITTSILWGILAGAIVLGCGDSGELEDCSLGPFCLSESSSPAAVCGDAIVDPGETCDDGNLIAGDGCSTDCLSDETCPNGTHDESVGEACDDGGDSETCTRNCTISRCRDGYVNSAAGEMCEPEGGVDTLVCDIDCTLPECGDGYVNRVTGERCDDGNQVDGDGCSSKCRLE
ncbi:MAG: DUF4215 domain-containing protein [Proteobacteria bacterium]|nr:DUF4215 domain-containing protein [Pseudomonadota bacterium]